MKEKINDWVKFTNSGGTSMAQSKKSSMNAERVYRMTFSSVYSLYILKAEKKGRTKEEVNEIIFWLTGYNKQMLQNHIENDSDFETFFTQAPEINPNTSKITGLICGYRVEEIEDKIIQKVRYLDKLIDELAKGRIMEKILRK